MDESNATCGKRLASIGLENTEANRQAYRTLLVTAPGLGQYISCGAKHCSRHQGWQGKLPFLFNGHFLYDRGSIVCYKAERWMMDGYYRDWLLWLVPMMNLGAKVLMALPLALLLTTNRVLVLPNGNSLLSSYKLLFWISSFSSYKIQWQVLMYIMIVTLKIL